MAKTIERMSRKPPAALANTVGQNGPTTGGPAPHDVWNLLDAARYAGPWIVGLGIIPGLGVLIRDLTAGNTLVQIFLAALWFTCAPGFALLAWLESAPRLNQFDRLRVSLSLAWLFLAVAGTMLLGGRHTLLIASPWVGVLLIVGFLLSLWWTIGTLPAVAGRGQDAHPAAPDLLAEKLGLGDSDITGAVHDEAGIRSVYRWQLKGVSIAQLRDACALLAVRLHIPANGIRVIENPDDASSPTMVVVRQDVLARMGTWPGPSRPGGSITEPCRVGMREDGSIVEVLKQGPLGGVHKLVAGMNGAGKTEGELNELAEIITRRDVVYIHIDLAKFGQTGLDIAPTMVRYAANKNDVVKIMRCLVKGVQWRAENAGGRTWKPTRQRPAIHVVMEEALFALESIENELLKFVSTARSVGEDITVSIQRPSGEILSTDIRAQFPDRQAYGVDNAHTADMILPEDMLENGARPEAWRQDYPGYQYRSVGTPDQKAMPARSWRIPVDVLRRHVAEWAPRMAELDEGTRRAMGPEWDELPTGASYALSHGWTRTVVSGETVWTPPPAETSGDEDGDGTETSAETAVSTSARPGSAPVPAYGTAPETSAETAVSGSETDDLDDDDRESSNEEEAMDRDLETARADIAEALGEIDPDLAAAFDESGPGEALTADQADFALFAGQGEPLDYAGRVAAVADVLANDLREANRCELMADFIQKTHDNTAVSLTVNVGDLAEVLAETVSGWYTGHRPALYRLFDKAQAAGQATHEGRGDWMISPSMPAWLRREVANLEDEEITDGDDEG